MNPSVGRIVWYIPIKYSATARENGTAGEPVPAIITKVHTEELINLRTLGEDQSEVLTSVKIGKDQKDKRSWIWPPRV